MVEIILWTVGVLFLIWLSAYIFFNYFYTLKGGQGGLDREEKDFLEEEKRKSAFSKNIKKKKKTNDDDDEDFLTSAIVGAATNSTLIGAAVGGSVAGAMLGDMLVDDEPEIDDYSSEDTEPDDNDCGDDDD